MRQVIILFTRVPAAGQTKTRLMPFLSGEECAALHTEFIKDIYESCSQADADILVCYTPEDKRGVLCSLMKAESQFIPQVDGDLGKRMRHAFEAAFHMGYERAVLIGTDIPQITPDILSNALKALDGCDIVIHPTVDGGYYLIGMKRNYECVWNIKRYGTNTVILDTLDQLKKAGLTVSVGTTCRDIDTKEDLMELYREIHTKKEQGMKHTRAYLEKLLSAKQSAKFRKSAER